ncbi:MAG TPA: ATP-binding cassette domain-containing protein [Caulobacteraceae bacterium]|nr:ATP-binding cassette domain-containing protein [Caulobacteraceae bacterium]
MTALITLEAAEVAYKGRGAALGPLNLELENGEAVALVGASGAGKSTALRLLAGLERPTRGLVRRDLGSRETSVVFQAPTLAPWLSALANVRMPLELSGVGRSESEARARAALERVGLKDALKARPAHLSGGMAMRVSLARALVSGPRLLLLDEPFAALDEITRRALADDVLSLWRERRSTMVFVTHNVEEAVYMAGRVLVLTPGPGRIAAERRVTGPDERPSGFRASSRFRADVETVSADLAQAMESN